jgi:DNA recombination protein RmuC
VSKQNEIAAMHNEKSTFSLMLSQKDQKLEESKESSSQRISELKKELSHEKLKSDDYREKNQSYSSEVSKLYTQLTEQSKTNQEKLELLQNNEAKLKTEFENLATKIFEENSKKQDARNNESLNNVLNPVKEQLRDFKKKVEDVYDKESTARGALQNELKTLKELNQKMTTEANNLTNALRSSNKQQGVWGEMVLENVLEKSGLRKDHEYFREVSLKDEDDKLFRPDVIVKLPDNRDIIIDAKTSLIAYSDYMSAEDEEAKKIHLKNHVKSINDHINGLADKNYENLKDVNSLDFIFMFMPIEGALLLALNSDEKLYDKAFSKKIILVSPTTLLVALRAVENTWRYEKQAQSIAAVYDRATKLYEKANTMIETFQKVGKAINTADKEYTKAFGLLQGNGGLVTQAIMLKKVSNIKPKKEIDVLLVDSSES